MSKFTNKINVIVLLRRARERERELKTTCTTEEDKDELSHQGIQVCQKKSIW
jgi:hypothetical protein